MLHVSRALGRDVFVKRDDRSHAVYGGNKIRKLVHLLADAQRNGATDVITVGAVGSHHVLATTIHAASLGMQTHAVLVPQPRTDHVEETVRADLAQNARLIAASGAWQVPARIAYVWQRLRRLGRSPYVIPVGGSSPLGARGYLDAVIELDEQIRARVMPGVPDTMVCALGSGGTLAGLLAGRADVNLACSVVGVRVTEAWMVSAPAVAWMGNGALRLAGTTVARRLTRHDVRVVHDQIGRGYGHATDEGRRATELFAEDGIVLDPTYTAKAAAGLLALARAAAQNSRLLFWHTLSSAPIPPLTVGSPAVVPAELAALMR